MSAFFEAQVLSVHHWTDRLFSFTTTRDPVLRFSNGHFVMLGLMVNNKPLLRAYSIVSANYEEHLEFLSIKVPDGPLTSRLQHIGVGDSLLIGKKPTGTLLIDYLLPAPRLYLFATGTGLAPFMAIIRDPETYQKFSEIILIHGVREVAELAYRDYIENQLPQDEFLGTMARQQLRYYPTVTREPFIRQQRIPELFSSGRIYQELSLPPLNPSSDRAMICGSNAMLQDCRSMLVAAGFDEGNTSTPGAFVVERAFVSS